jgi:hypothetical protein
MSEISPNLVTLVLATKLLRLAKPPEMKLNQFGFSSSRLIRLRSLLNQIYL